MPLVPLRLMEKLSPMLVADVNSMLHIARRCTHKNNTKMVKSIILVAMKGWIQGRCRLVPLASFERGVR